MSLQRVLRTLTSFGLTTKEAEVYVHLAREGPQKPEDAARSLKLDESIVTLALHRLEGKEIVNRICGKSNVYSALPFEKAIEILVKWHLEETRILEQNRDEILMQWKSLMKKDYAK